MVTVWTVFHTRRIQVADSHTTQFTSCSKHTSNEVLLVFRLTAAAEGFKPRLHSTACRCVLVLSCQMYWGKTSFFFFVPFVFFLYFFWIGLTLIWPQFLFIHTLTRSELQLPYQVRGEGVRVLGEGRQSASHSIRQDSMLDHLTCFISAFKIIKNISIYYTYTK